MNDEAWGDTVSIGSYIGALLMLNYVLVTVSKPIAQPLDRTGYPIKNLRSVSPPLAKRGPMCLRWRGEGSLTAFLCLSISDRALFFLSALSSGEFSMFSSALR